MALSKALVQSFRKNQLLIGAGWRAFFAPFNAAFNSSQTNSQFGPQLLDLQFGGPFNTNNMPAGWQDLGWIRDYKMTPSSKIGQIKSGYRGAVRQQVRGEIGESFEFRFREASRMAFRISTGTEIFNLLSGTVAGNAAGPLSASGALTVPLGASGFQATGGTATDPRVAGQPTLFLPPGSGASFAINNMVVVDIDYDKVSTGFIGSNGIPIFVNNAPQDVDFIRKTSDFVNRVALVVLGPIAGIAGNQDALVLSGPFVGGGNSITSLAGPIVPPAAAKIQKISGWAAREGGTFILDWSALFILDTQDGDQFAQYYPHVSINQFKELANWSIANVGNTDLTGYELDTQMEALAYDDPLDGETVVCYRAYYPAVGVQI